MNVDANGRSHHPAGSPKSIGGQYANEATPAASGSLLVASNTETTRALEATEEHWQNSVTAHHHLVAADAIRTVARLLPGARTIHFEGPDPYDDEPAISGLTWVGDDGTQRNVPYDEAQQIEQALTAMVSDFYGEEHVALVPDGIDSNRGTFDLSREDEHVSEGHDILRATFGAGTADTDTAEAVRGQLWLAVRARGAAVAAETIRDTYLDRDIVAVEYEVDYDEDGDLWPFEHTLVTRDGERFAASDGQGDEEQTVHNVIAAIGYDPEPVSDELLFGGTRDQIDDTMRLDLTRGADYTVFAREREAAARALLRA